MTEISTMSFPPSVQMLHFDLDDFFNEGTPTFLAHQSADVLCTRLRSLASDVATFLLDHQYVTTPVDPDFVWGVTRGSGQGLVASAATAISQLLLVGWTFSLQVFDRPAPWSSHVLSVC